MMPPPPPPPMPPPPPRAAGAARALRRKRARLWRRAVREQVAVVRRLRAAHGPGDLRTQLQAQDLARLLALHTLVGI